MYKLTLEIKGTKEDIYALKSKVDDAILENYYYTRSVTLPEPERQIIIEKVVFDEVKFYRMCDILEKKFWANVKRLEKEGKIQGRDFV